MSKRSKRPYRAVSLDRFEWLEVFDQVPDRRVIVGVDVAKEAMVGAVMDDGESVIKTVRWSHPRQMGELLAFLQGLASSSKEVEIAMEPSGVYGDALRWQLLEAGFRVFRVSPKKSYDMSEIYDGVPSSHDGKSAAIVATLHYRGASDSWPVESTARRKLSAALRLLEVYGKQYRQNRNRLEALTARHWPELTAVLELGTATALEVLATYGGPTGVAMDPDAAAALMHRVGGAMLGREKVENVVRSAQTSTGLPQIPEENSLVRELAVETQRNRAAANRARKRVEDLACAGGATKEIAPVVGKATAAVIVASIGDPREFESPQALVKAVGLNLRERSSGKKQGGLHITKRGSGVARLYLWMAALRLIQLDPVIRAWYAKKVHRQGGQARAKAVVAVMRKVVLALWHVARGNPFDSTRLFDTRRLGKLHEI
jgi:transposase